jgi:hypothetical protein
MGEISSPPFGMHRFTLLAQGESEMVFGLCGRFWRADFGIASIPDGATFKSFDEAGVPKLVMRFWIRGADEARLASSPRREFIAPTSKRSAPSRLIGLRSARRVCSSEDACSRPLLD